ncbi:DUF6090 family protein [Aegicerativicinus sediminis]|uniref:DUF6090 family protein n=1 Tax=Aegicerativicinus sediminis TaxID=2893202 RepID=UPI001E49DEC7|nr:DUF6090 family protein [Aegicerativicinus sediminis]
MPTIFRKMRIKFLGNNKAKSYALYAIGEIILVVIGILLALQINNWQENKKLKEDENYILNEILDNLRQDEIQIKGILERRIKAQKSIDRILKDVPHHINRDSFEVDMGRVITLERFYPIKTAYEVSKAKGLQISNRRLRSEIAQYYEFEINRSNSSIRDIENAFVNDLQILVDANFDNIDYGNRIYFLNLDDPAYLELVKRTIVKYRANHYLSLEKIKSFYGVNHTLQQAIKKELDS